ncbi:MAG TPA: AI-2E family transporter [Stellaceae bacterium]|nr:AI-2E family transporter [Stellaceae bacterium]
MTVGQRQQVYFWLGALVFFFLIVYLLSPILLPFVAGSAIAYFLDPAVRRLTRWRVPRGLATVLALLLFVLLLLLVFALLVPLVEAQAGELSRRVPGMVAEARGRFEHLMEFVQQQLAPEDVAKLRDALGSGLGDVASWLARLIQHVLTSGIALANLLSLIFLTPVVSFFLLRDWDAIVRRVDGWLPRQHAATIREQARLVDATLSGYLHGQLLVCLGVGVYYAAALSLIRLDFGLIIGVLAGILTFIPYVGFATGLVLALSLALLQYGTFSGLLAVIVVFAIGQVLESNVLAPKLVGTRVHLHPVWVIFALLAFGSVFGFLGVLLALPAAAVIGVLVRFALARYLASPLYDPANRHPSDR